MVKPGMGQDATDLARTAHCTHRDNVTSLELRSRLAAKIDRDSVGGVHDKEAADGWIVIGDLHSAKVNRVTAAGFRRRQGVGLTRRAKNGKGGESVDVQREAGHDEDTYPWSAARFPAPGLPHC